MHPTVNDHDAGLPRPAQADLRTAIERALDDYQDWTITTAKYPESLAIPYLALGVGDEAGELLEKAEDPDRRYLKNEWARRHLLPEAGDIGWYLAQLLRRFGIKMSDAFALSQNIQPGFDATLHSVVTDVVINATKLQGRVKKHLRDEVDVAEKVRLYAAHMLRGLDALSRFYGTNLLLVLGENRQKLEDRLNRNAIQGEGDHR